MTLVVVYTVVALNALRKRERVPRPSDLVALACRGALMGWDRAKEGGVELHRSSGDRALGAAALDGGRWGGE